MMGKQTGTKKPLKEKIVQIYETFFQGEDPSKGNVNFWDELFLLRVNVKCIDNQFENLTNEELLQLKNVFNTLFYHCVQALKAEHQIRIVNALQTLSALVRGVYRKGISDHGFDAINLLVGFDDAESHMQDLIERICHFLSGEYPHSLKSLVQKFLLVLVTVTENVSQNTMLEFLMMNSVFEALIQILADPQARTNHGYYSVLLLTILISYRKYEAANPYMVKLSILDNELALNGYGQVVNQALSDFNKKFIASQTEPQAGILYTITSMVGSMFLADEDELDRERIRANNAVLLALYEAVHLNRNFLTTLTHSQADIINPVISIGDSAPTDATISDSATIDAVSVRSLPSNLLVTFLEFCSIVMQDSRDEQSVNTCKLCFIIFTCIAEDQYANSIMHDVNMVFKVQLHRMPMRHRKITVDKGGPARPLVCSLLDLTVEFILSHMRKNLLMDLYLRCLGVIHRILCYQKKCRVRLIYSWKDLWNALISLLKFLLGHESELVKKYNIFHLAIQVVNIFNLFITYGDTFLPSAASYDELYYELIRMHQVFNNMYSMALRYTTGDEEWKEAACSLTNNLVNIRAIINHFTPKIDSWSATNHLSALTEQQVLDVVRSNYDTLTLKLQDNLDQHERYSEKPREMSFFTQMLRSVVSDYRQTEDFSSLEQHSVLQDFSTIT